MFLGVTEFYDNTTMNDTQSSAQHRISENRTPFCKQRVNFLCFYLSIYLYLFFRYLTYVLYDILTYVFLKQIQLVNIFYVSGRL
jgi:hypothetical protein